MDQNQLDAALAKLEMAWAQHQVYVLAEIRRRGLLEQAGEQWEEALKTKEDVELGYKAWKSCLHEWVAAKERLVHSSARIDECIAAFRD